MKILILLGIIMIIVFSVWYANKSRVGRADRFATDFRKRKTEVLFVQYCYSPDTDWVLYILDNWKNKLKKRWLTTFAAHTAEQVARDCSEFRNSSLQCRFEAAGRRHCGGVALGWSCKRLEDLMREKKTGFPVILVFELLLQTHQDI